MCIPKSPNSIQFTVEKLWDDLKYLRNYDNKKKNDSYWKRYDKFVEKVHLVPDLIESDDERRKVHKKLWNCKMNENDKSFHKLQLQDPPTGYCSTFVDKKWKKTQERKESRLNRSRSEYYDFFTSERSDENQSQNVVDDMEVDPTFQVEEFP